MTSGPAFGREALEGLAQRLAGVEGVVGAVLGGSRARDEHHPGADVELALYYRPPLDIAALGTIAREVDRPTATVTAPGEWGRWADGGAWLHVGGVVVDWSYRDLARVLRAWDDARDGTFGFHHAVGHPLGVPDFAYVGELALGVVLADPTGELAVWHERFQDYPEALADALVASLWEANLLVEVAHRGVPRHDTTYVAACLARALLMCAHAIHGRAGRWLVDERGAIAAADRLPGAPEGFAARAHAILAGLDTAAEPMESALAAAVVLVRDVGKRLRSRPPA
ncbi:nucleotidyltransferase domain-containing protein [Georgenia thermotolerans]|uniref:DNA polymerase subunit beta n=1 Tax=Georgenia thermotolerans TaxID=527326 RepID=A0A7J5UJ95_9MICO|nr:nucleotidyltransferase domain-containing protein [Georgenia thermotolerans]KAE8762224.1 DNA polymerase subunit beta [Georgenia thermotolerans]